MLLARVLEGSGGAGSLHQFGVSVIMGSDAGSHLRQTLQAYLHASRNASAVAKTTLGVMSSGVLYHKGRAVYVVGASGRRSIGTVRRRESLTRLAA
jgi:hypothetical protein